MQASAWVFVNGNGNVLGGNVNLTYSKSAFNNTKNQDATAVIASREDYITYTLTVQNSGTGTLTGTASVSAPFSILSGASYSLAAGASQTVTVVW